MDIDFKSDNKFLLINLILKNSLPDELKKIASNDFNNEYDSILRNKYNESDSNKLINELYKTEWFKDEKIKNSLYLCELENFYFNNYKKIEDAIYKQKNINLGTLDKTINLYVVNDENIQVGINLLYGNSSNEINNSDLVYIYKLILKLLGQ